LREVTYFDSNEGKEVGTKKEEDDEKAKEVKKEMKKKGIKKRK
jgi:hypothetical protein